MSDLESEPMEQMIYSNSLNWLRQGNEVDAAKMFEKCSLELHFVDLGFEVSGERMYNMYDLTIYAPRNIYESTTKEAKEQIEQIENAIHSTIHSDDIIRGIRWLGKAESPETESPVHLITLEILQETGAERVKREWQKSLNRLENDTEGAITAARTLFESICKLILEDRKIAYDNNDDLPRLYRKVTKVLDLSTDKQTNDIFRRIFGGAQTIVSSLAEMRNVLGDAHGKSQNVVTPEKHQAALAVNLAGTLAVFLVETWRSQAKGSSKRKRTVKK
jgi:hypothetical protein